jgi:tyrosine-protein phosphatase SIW14
MNTRYLTILLLFIISSCANKQPQTVRNTEWACKVDGTCLHNFYRVTDSIYRSEQPDGKAIPYFDSIGIKSILNLREYHSDSIRLHKKNLHYYSVKIVAGNFTDKQIIQSLKIIKDAPKPILIHCMHGSDRTGVVVAMYRIIFQNWTKARAIDELEHGNYGFHSRYKNIPAFIIKADTGAIKKALSL